MKTIQSFVLLLLLSLSTTSLATQMLSGKVVSVEDGATFNVLDEQGNMHQLALYGVTLPDPKLGYSERSRGLLRMMISGKQVTFSKQGTDSHGRTTAEVYLNNLTINGAMIKSGYVEVDPKTCTNQLCKDWYAYQLEARTKGSGIWKNKKAIEHAQRWADIKAEVQSSSTAYQRSTLSPQGQVRRDPCQNGKVHVNPYTRKDGTYVRGHDRCR